MKTTALFCAVSFLACSSSFAGRQHPAFIDQGIVHLRGAITDQACSVSSGNDDFIVNMGEFRSSQFNGLGSYAPPVLFEIILNDCRNEVKEQVTINFLGVSDDKDPLVFQAGNRINTSSGAGMAIFDSDGKIIPPNALPRLFAYRNREDKRLRFVVRYRATSYQVTAGNADSWIWLTLSYQ